jgi:competence CoiA-like predicted nuclease
MTMPLKGKNKQTNDEALVFESFDILRAWQRSADLVCPFCDEDLVAVRGYMRQQGDSVNAYLRHKGECSTTLAHHPESPEHFAAKKWILENIASRYDVATSDCEVRMPEINRIADVCFVLANGDRVVHEAQLSPIGVDDLEARTNDYESLGYGIVWHFGKYADTQSNKQWAFNRLGGCEVLSFDVHIVDI